MDRLDQIILDAAYTRIEESESKRVTGTRVWDDVGPVLNVAPVVIPARLRRLVSPGLLERDKSQSSNRYKVYSPTAAGYTTWRAMKAGTALGR